MSQIVYIGTYVEIPKQYKEVTETFLDCPRNHANFVLTGNYCPKCGSKLSIVTMKQTREMSQIEYNDKFFPFSVENTIVVFDNGQTVCVTSNWQNIGGHYITENVSFPKIIDADFIKSQKAIFREKLAKEIEILEKHFGALDVKFGILSKND